MGKVEYEGLIYIFAGGWEGNLNIFKIEVKENGCKPILVHVLKIYETTVTSMCVLNVERIVIGSRKGEIKLFRIKDLVNGKAEIYQKFEGHQDCVCTITKISDYMFGTGSWDGSCRIWNVDKEYIEVKHSKFAIWKVCVMNDRIVTFGADDSIRLWGIQKVGEKNIRLTGKNIAKETAHGAPIRFGFIEEGEGENGIISMCSNGIIKRWKVDDEELKLVSSYELPNTIYFDAFHIHNAFAVCSDLNEILIVDDKQFKVVDSFPTKGCVWSVINISEKNIAIGGEDKKIIGLCSVSQDLAEESDVEKKYFEELSQTSRKMNLGKEIIFESIGEINEVEIGRFYKVKAEGEAEDRIDEITFILGLNRFIKTGEFENNTSRPKVIDEEGNEFDFKILIQIENHNIEKEIYFNEADNLYNIAKDFLIRNKIDFMYLFKITKFLIEERKSYIGRKQTLSKESTFPLKEASDGKENFKNVQNFVEKYCQMNKKVELIPVLTNINHPLFFSKVEEIIKIQKPINYIPIIEMLRYAIVQRPEYNEQIIKLIKPMMRQRNQNISSISSICSLLRSVSFHANEMSSGLIHFYQWSLFHHHFAKRLSLHQYIILVCIKQ